MDKEIHISVLSVNQLHTVLDISEKSFSRIYVDFAITDSVLNLDEDFSDFEIYLSSPYVIRKGDIELLEKVLASGKFAGVLIRNLEVFAFLNTKCEKFSNLKVVIDSGLYILNHEAFDFFTENSKLEIIEFYNSLELNERENSELVKNIDNGKESFLIYGRIPMMVTANCVRKTIQSCKNQSGFVIIEDRYEKDFPVYCNCRSCYNVIYNSVVLSLHKQYKELIKEGNVRIDFTTEDNSEVLDILAYFESLKNKYTEPKYKEYTTGHFKRGVE